MISAAAYLNSLKRVLHLDDFNPLSGTYLIQCGYLNLFAACAAFFSRLCTFVTSAANMRAIRPLPRKALIASQRRRFNPSGMIQIPHEAYAQQSDSADRSVQVVQSDASDRCWCGCPEADSH